MKTNRLASTLALTLLLRRHGHGGPRGPGAERPVPVLRDHAVPALRLADGPALGPRHGRWRHNDDPERLHRPQAVESAGRVRCADHRAGGHGEPHGDRLDCAGPAGLAGCARIPLEGDRRSVALGFCSGPAKRSRTGDPAPRRRRQSRNGQRYPAPGYWGRLPRATGASSRTTGPSTSPAISSRDTHSRPDRARSAPHEPEHVLATRMAPGTHVLHPPREVGTQVGLCFHDRDPFHPSSSMKSASMSEASASRP